MYRPTNTLAALIVSIIAATTIGCAPLNSGTGYPPSNSGGYYGGSGYGNQYPYGGGYQGNGYQDNGSRQERRKLEQERERLEDERNRLEQERRRKDQAARPPPPPARPAPERCPSGFHPSEQKCSREERRRGCQDMRLPGGLGCVKR